MRIGWVAEVSKSWLTEILYKKYAFLLNCQTIKKIHFYVLIAIKIQMWYAMHFRKLTPGGRYVIFGVPSPAYLGNNPQNIGESYESNIFATYFWLILPMKFWFYLWYVRRTTNPKNDLMVKMHKNIEGLLLNINNHPSLKIGRLGDSKNPHR